MWTLLTEMLLGGGLTLAGAYGIVGGFIVERLSILLVSLGMVFVGVTVGVRALALLNGQPFTF